MNRTTALNAIKDLIIGLGFIEVEIISKAALERIDVAGLRLPYFAVTWGDAEHLPEHPEVYDMSITVYVFNERFGHPRGQDTQLEVTGLVEQLVDEINLLASDELPVIGFISTTSSPDPVKAGEHTLQMASLTFQVTTWDDEY